ncbi:MAG TPA: 50S ribosomal protein L22 [Candidatus Paceibacterota bacterium]|nr:50S ribosomal protein L22 [Candidatus Paceibacterota bacterium]
MASVSATLSNYRQAPRKVRLAVDLIRGKSAVRALDILAFTTKRASNPIKKLLESAIANAKNQNIAVETLTVKEVRVDAGVVLKRMMPRARGRGAQILKRTSRVIIVLSDEAPKSSAK